jgi:hypothetical protein
MKTWQNASTNQEPRYRSLLKQEQAFAIYKVVEQSSSASEREKFVVACIAFIYMKISICFIKQACFLAARAHIHIADLIACIIFLYMKIFACLIKQACLLAIISKGLMIRFYG